MARNRRDLTLDQARALADKWHDMAESHKEADWLAGRFAGATPHELIDMWASGRVIEDPKMKGSRNGKAFTKAEVQALGEQWMIVFGCHPPDPGNGQAPAAPQQPPALMPADDTMLSIREVRRVTGLSPSTIKRKMGKTFPAPTKISTRRIGWPAGVVKMWLAERDADS